jgi:hypothetical protein
MAYRQACQIAAPHRHCGADGLPCNGRGLFLYDSTGGKGKNMGYGGLGGLIVLIADVWAIVNIFQSGGSTGDKVLWTVLVLVLPILGFILWYFFGPRTGRA